MTFNKNNQPNVIEDLFRQRYEQAELRRNVERAIQFDHARSSVAQSPKDPHVYIDAARSCKQLGQLREALAILELGVKNCEPDSSLYDYFIERLEKCNRTQEAIDLARTAAKLFPDDLIFKFREALLLPVLYESQQQLDFYRDRINEGLSRLIQEVPLNSKADIQRALSASLKNSNKYLAYQGQNDREFQSTYGGWIHQIASAAYPEFSHAVKAGKTRSGKRVRVGYVSSRLREGSVTKAFLGWIREHDRKRVDIHVFHIGSANDDSTIQWQTASEHFFQLPLACHEVASAIQSANLDVLVFLDVGMAPSTAVLAALRLAPVQCVAWDHPVTSGLPTINYFLTGELMEAEGFEEQYSERVIRLPGVGVCYRKPVIPENFLFKTRREFSLRENAIIYLSPQTIFKYLPAQDELFARIAQRVPNSQFVFLMTNEIVGAEFSKRLESAFAECGLNSEDHCVILPEVSQLDYWNLLRVSDVVLDTIGWSGAVSTFETVAGNVPIVTLPKKLMRSRQSYAILKQLGVTETIAASEDEYIEISVRMALDNQERNRISERMAAAHSHLYSDVSNVRALEDFYDNANLQTS